MENKPKIAVFGGGSWATAIVKILSENLDEIGWYMRSVYTLEHIKRNQHNPNYLSSVEFETEKLNLSNDINEMVNYADYLILAIPSAFLQKELDKLTVPLKGKIIFSAIKGIVPESSFIVGEHFHEKDAFIGFWGTPVAPLTQLKSVTNGSLAPTIYEYITGENIVVGENGWGFPSVLDHLNIKTTLEN